MNIRIRYRAALLAAAMATMTAAATYVRADTGTCGGANTTLPFADVMSSPFFCQIAAAYFSGLTNGTSPTTYNPGDPVPREQMAAFVTRTMDQSLKRGSQRAALDQFWTTQTADNLALTTVGTQPFLVKSDGADLWVANNISNTVSRVRATDGTVLGTWTGATGATGVLLAMGNVFVTASTNPGKLYRIDPSPPPGIVTTVTSSLGVFPFGIAYDGQRIWTANFGTPGSVSIVTLNPFNVTTVTTGFSGVIGIIYDGANIWVTDFGDDTIKKLASTGAVLLSVPLGANANPFLPAFDGTNIWVPNNGSHTVSVIRASTGVVLATLTGNGLNTPAQAAFDGERILVTNFNGNSVSLWKASDLTPLGTFPTGASTTPEGACSDGLNFWIALRGTGKLARF